MLYLLKIESSYLQTAMLVKYDCYTFWPIVITLWYFSNCHAFNVLRFITASVAQKKPSGLSHEHTQSSRHAENVCRCCSLEIACARTSAHRRSMPSGTQCWFSKRWKPNWTTIVIFLIATTTRTTQHQRDNVHSLVCTCQLHSFISFYWIVEVIE